MPSCCGSKAAIINSGVAFTNFASCFYFYEWFPSRKIWAKSRNRKKIPRKRPRGSRRPRKQWRLNLRELKKLRILRTRKSLSLPTKRPVKNMVKKMRKKKNNQKWQLRLWASRSRCRSWWQRTGWRRRKSRTVALSSATLTGTRTLWMLSLLRRSRRGCSRSATCRFTMRARFCARPLARRTRGTSRTRRRCKIYN